MVGAAVDEVKEHYLAVESNMCPWFCVLILAQTNCEAKIQLLFNNNSDTSLEAHGKLSLIDLYSHLLSWRSFKSIGDQILF